MLYDGLFRGLTKTVSKAKLGFDPHYNYES